MCRGCCGNRTTEIRSPSGRRDPTSLSHLLYRFSLCDFGGVLRRAGGVRGGREQFPPGRATDPKNLTGTRHIVEGGRAVRGGTGCRSYAEGSLRSGGEHCRCCSCMFRYFPGGRRLGLPSPSGLLDYFGDRPFILAQLFSAPLTITLLGLLSSLVTTRLGGGLGRWGKSSTACAGSSEVGGRGR